MVSLVSRFFNYYFRRFISLSLSQHRKLLTMKFHSIGMNEKSLRLVIAFTRSRNKTTRQGRTVLYGKGRLYHLKIVLSRMMNDE